MCDVALVGAGPGDEKLLTVRAVELLRQATLVLADPGAATELAYRLCPASTTISPADRSLVELVAGGRRGVVRLLAGDGLGPDVLRDVAALRRAGARVEVVPGVASGPAVAAYAGIPVGHDRVAVGAGRAARALRGPVQVIDARNAWDAAGAAADGSLVLTGPWSAVRLALVELLAAGRPEREDVLLVQAGTTARQTSRTMTLAEAARTPHAGSAAAGDQRDEDIVAVVGPAVAARGEAAWFEARALFGWHVLLPSTQAEPAEEAARIAALGGTSESVPTVAVAPPRTRQQMDRAIHRMVTGEHAWVAFTAEGAVQGVRDRLTELGLDARALAGLRIATVAGATADAVRAWGIEPDLVPCAAGVQALLAEWPARDPGVDPISGVLLPRAQIATETFASGLAELGWTVDEVTAFRTLRADPPAPAIRAAIKRGSYDAVLFASAAGLRNFVGIAGKPHPTTVVGCIGPATARAAEENGLRVDLVASEPTVEGLVEALAAYAVADEGLAHQRAH